MLQVKNRVTFFYVERTILSVVDGCLIATDRRQRARFEVPARAAMTLMLGPGCSITSEAIRLAAAYGILVTWVGEQGVRTYSAGRTWTANSEWLERQVQAYGDEGKTLRVVQAMFEKRFGAPIRGRSVEQLRGIEGGRVKEIYRQLAAEHRVPWNGRRYEPGNPGGATDAPNLAINVANTCLYGLSEVAVLAMGTHTGLGFLHRGSQSSFVLDVADLYKMEVSVPLAFRIVGESGHGATPWETLERDVRRAARDLFRRERLVERMIPDIEEILLAADSP